jgi:hypothetical protein
MKVIQPVTWAGMTKPGSNGDMVCGACPDPAECSHNELCERATAEDYAYAMRTLAGGRK